MVIRVLGFGTGYLFTFLIARLYGASVMGSFALVQAIMMITALLARLGLDTASVRFISENYAKGEYGKLRNIYFTSIRIIIPVAVLFSGCLFFLSPILANNIMNKPELELLFPFASFGVLPFSLLFIHSECFRGMKKIIHYSLFRRMTMPFIASIILLIFYYSGITSNKGPLYSYLLAVYILSLVAFVIWIYEMPNSDGHNPQINVSNLLRVSFPMLLTSSMAYLLQWTGLFILGIYRPVWEIGVYNVAVKVSLLTSIGLFAINSIAAPKFAELFAKHDMKNLESVVHQSNRLIFWASAPVLLFFLIYPTFFLKFFGEEYIFGKWALIFLIIGRFISAISGSVAYILLMTGKQKIYFYIKVISLIINIILNILLIPKFGITGAAIANGISIAVWNLTSVIVVKINLNILTLYIPKFIRMKKNNVA